MLWTNPEPPPRDLLGGQQSGGRGAVARPRLIDLSLKHGALPSRRLPSYWTVDRDELVLTAWELGEGSYAQVSQVGGDDEFRPLAPLSLVVVPARLAR